MSKSIVVNPLQKEKNYNVQWLRTFEGFEDYSEEQAERELISLKGLSEIICQHLLNTS